MYNYILKYIGKVSLENGIEEYIYSILDKGCRKIGELHIPIISRKINWIVDNELIRTIHAYIKQSADIHIIDIIDVIKALYENGELIERTGKYINHLLTYHPRIVILHNVLDKIDYWKEILNPKINLLPSEVLHTVLGKCVHCLESKLSKNDYLVDFDGGHLYIWFLKLPLSKYLPNAIQSMIECKCTEIELCK